MTDMAEHVPQPTDPDTLAAQLVDGLRQQYPGIVDEWERQRTESPHDSFPDFQSASDALWWLDSEITQAESFIAGDDTGTEQAIADYCRNAVEQLRTALQNQPPEPAPEPVTWAEYIGTNLVAAAMNLERTGNDLYRLAIEAHMQQLKDVVRELVPDKEGRCIQLEVLEDG